MKVLTIRQPWATLIIKKYKRFEFRSWFSKYRGDLLIHAGKTIDKDAYIRLKKYLPENLPLGKIIGKVTLVSCKKCDESFKQMCLKENKDIYAKSNFNEEYAWELENIIEFDNPIDVKGKLGLWNFNLDNYNTNIYK